MMKCPRFPFVASLAVASLLMLGASVGAADKATAPPKDLKEFRSGDFNERSTTIDNEWFPLKPGTRLVWEGSTVDDEGDLQPHRVVLTVTDLTKVINGVRTVVCWDQDFEDGELVEAEIVFFAQSKNGEVWHFGQYPEEYDEGKVVASPGWIHGFDTCLAGIHMPAKPKLGDPGFYQGWAPKVPWTDRAVVQEAGVKVTVPSGTYEDVLVFDESNLEEPDSHQLKYYARGIGNIKVGFLGKDDQSEKLELTKVEKLDVTEMAEAREAAWKLEKNAAERLADVFAKSKPLERLFGKLTEELAKEIALKKVKGKATDAAVETKFGKETFVVEVLTDDGEEIDVVIDLETGKVLAVED